MTNKKSKPNKKAKPKNKKASAKPKAKGKAKKTTRIPIPVPSSSPAAPATPADTTPTPDPTPIPSPPSPYPEVDVTVLRGRQDMIPNKYKAQRLNAWSTQHEKLQFLWDLGYRKVSRDIFSEIEFSETAPVQLTSSGANYGKFILQKEINEQDFNLINTEQG